MAGQADLEKALADIKAGKVKPLILICGDEEYLVKQAYDRLLEALVPEALRSFNLEQLDGARVESATLMDAFDIVPMMEGPKAVGVPEARFFSGKSDSEEMLQRAAEAWGKGETQQALRLAGRVLTLAEWGWQEASERGLGALAEALEIELPAQEQAALRSVFEQGIKSDFPLPKGGDEGGELADRLEASLASGAPGVRTLVFSTSMADARKKITKLVQAKGLVLEFKSEKKAGPGSGQTAAVFLRNLMSQRGLTAPMSALQRLIGAYGHDLGLLVRELDKLESYVHPSKQISDQAIDEMGSPQLEDRVYELMGFLEKKDLGGALKILDRLLASDVHPMQIFASLSNELRLLALCRALMDEGRVPAGAARDYYSYKASIHPKLGQELPAGLASYFKKANPYRCYLAFQKARQLDAARLREMLGVMLEADLGLKSSRVDARVKLEEICLLIGGVREELIF